VLRCFDDDDVTHVDGKIDPLADLETEARAHWDIVDVLIIHRVGELLPADQIVLVMVSSVVKVLPARCRSSLASRR